MVDMHLLKSDTQIKIRITTFLKEGFYIHLTIDLLKVIKCARDFLVEFTSFGK